MIIEESPPTNLTTTEQHALAQHEVVIERGKAAFCDAGNALKAIRDARLYRQEYGTFEAYCQQRWGMARRSAYQMIAAAAVVENVRNCAQIPANEAQARALAAVPPAVQAQAWQRAVETAPAGKVTAGHVERTIKASPHAVHFSSETPEWYTPQSIIERVLRVFRVISLDPCSNSTTHPNVPAQAHFTRAENGLSRSWWGNVYMNPPYGDDVAAWVSYLMDQYAAGEIDAAIALLPARTDTAWFQPLYDHTLCFIRGRITFVGADNGAPFPSVVVYCGMHADLFYSAFRDMGRVGQLLSEVAR